MSQRIYRAELVDDAVEFTAVDVPVESVPLSAALAAPELLEACIEVAHWMDADVSGLVDCAMGARAMEKVRAAIKRVDDLEDMSGDPPATFRRLSGDLSATALPGQGELPAKQERDLREVAYDWKEEACRQSRACVALTAERDALQRRVGRAEELLQRFVKYAREDRAVTPGFTRLERLVDETSAALAASQKEETP